MGTSGRKFTAKFKTKIVLEALQEPLSISDMASKFEVHPTQIRE